MSIISPKSGLSPRKQSRRKVPEVYGGRLVKKIGFEPRVKREEVEEGRNYDVHELPWAKCGECEGDWLVDWRIETESWFQRCGNAKQNQRFVIFK